jgi:class 3 adenylate cyclase
MAARIASYARPREVGVTQEVVDASGNVSATFSEIGPVELQGIPGAIRLHAAHRATSPPSGEAPPPGRHEPVPDEAR